MAPDAQRLADALLFNRPVGPADLRLPYRAKGLLVGGYLLKLLLVVPLIWDPLQSSLEMHQSMAAAAADRVNAVWVVQRFVRDGVEAPPLATDATRWKSLAVARARLVQLRTMNDAVSYLSLIVDSSKKQWILSRRSADPDHHLEKITLHAEEADPARFDFDLTQAAAEKPDLVLEGDSTGRRCASSSSGSTPARSC